MARVKTFRIHPIHGVPDKDIRVFLEMCEKEMFVNVSTTLIPEIIAKDDKGNIIQKSDPRLTVIVTKLDDLHGDHGETFMSPIVDEELIVT